MKAAGFVSVASAYDHLRFEQNLAAWFDIIAGRDTCSQLLAISSASYQAGLKRLARDIADASKPRSREDHLRLITVCGESPGGGILDRRSNRLLTADGCGNLLKTTYI